MFDAFLRLAGYVTLLLIAPLGGLCMYSAVAQHQQGSAARDWPTTEGEVTSASVRTEITTETRRSAGRYGGGTSSTESRTYHADIHYVYTVDGTQYEAGRVVVDEFGTGDRGRAEQIIAKYPVGSKVTVYYDPKRPSVTVLEPGTSGGSVTLFVFGLVFLTAAVGLGWLALKKSDPFVTRPLVFLLPGWAAVLVPGPVKRWMMRRHMHRLGMDPDQAEADSEAVERWNDPLGDP